jgi:hypothetical protein
MIHIWSHVETLVITKHNFLVNHVKLFNKIMPMESVMSSMYVFAQICWGLYILSSVKAPAGWFNLWSSWRSCCLRVMTSCQDTYSDFTTFQSRPTLVPSTVVTVQKSFMTWISSSFSTLSYSGSCGKMSCPWGNNHCVQECERHSTVSWTGHTPSYVYIRLRIHSSRLQGHLVKTQTHVV